MKRTNTHVACYRCERCCANLPSHSRQQYCRANMICFGNFRKDFTLQPAAFPLCRRQITITSAADRLRGGLRDSCVRADSNINTLTAELCFDGSLACQWCQLQPVSAVSCNFAHVNHQLQIVHPSSTRLSLLAWKHTVYTCESSLKIWQQKHITHAEGIRNTILCKVHGQK